MLFKWMWIFTALAERILAWAALYSDMVRTNITDLNSIIFIYGAYQHKRNE
jgi:hypothetical protein